LTVEPLELTISVVGSVRRIAGAMPEIGMKAHLAELVTVVLEKLESQAEAPPSERGMRSWLARLGYNKRDIDAVIKMVWPRLAAGRMERTPGAMRQLSSYELYKLAPEARAALARLEMCGLVEPWEREMLLERLGQFEGEVGMDDLDYLLSWVLCSTRDVETQQTIYNVFEGHRETFH
jgi:uncharacterized protein Smg (DUF494 family)